jgi:phosphate uptake regulator
MFSWLRGSRDSITEIVELFTSMLADGRHVFDLAMRARLGDADSGDVADELISTEERTDEAERDIRRRVVVHASLHGTEELAVSLMYMSIAKDAERVADLAKGVFGIAETAGPPPPGAVRDDFARLAEELSPMITEAGRILSEEDQAAAEAFIEQARRLQEHCRHRIGELLREEADVPQAAATVLTYRHCGRIAANLLNITSAVIMPLDQLDYPVRQRDP